MDTMIATFEDTENSLTPTRRSFLLKREIAKENRTRRIRERAMALEFGLKKLLAPNNPRHIIEPKGYKDDLRGLVNPDGSIHLWPMGEMTHVRRAEKYNLLNSAGLEGIHFYVYFGENVPRGSMLCASYNADLYDEVCTILNYFNVLTEMGERRFEDYPEPHPPQADPYEDDPLGWDDYDDDFLSPEPYEERIPHPVKLPSPVQYYNDYVVETRDGVYVARPGRLWAHDNYAECIEDCLGRNMNALALGITTRYTVVFKGRKARPVRATYWD